MLTAGGAGAKRGEEDQSRCVMLDWEVWERCVKQIQTKLVQ
jgi:hypothetical protein